MAAGKQVVKAPDLYREKYGVRFNPLRDPQTNRPMCAIPDWKIEARMYLCAKEKAPKGWLGKAEHFMRMMTYLLSASKKPFQWNPNAKRIVQAYFDHDFVAIAGHGGSGKSETIAIISIGEFVSSPEDTAILVTSTSLSESRSRIWGRIEVYWQDVCDYFGGEQNTPGELVSSSGLIRYKLGNRKDDTRGIKLVPGKESEVREGVGRMKGFHAKRVRFMADELSDLSHKLLEAAESNLFTNPDFKMAAAFNPASFFDPAGVFSEPKDGWGSVNVITSDGWDTKRGYCIRFDGEKSPNVLCKDGEKLWEGLLTKEKLEDRRKFLGDNSPIFMSQYRGSWSEVGLADGIYSEAEIIKYRGMSKVEVWTSAKTKAGGFDPSFVHDGDRAVLVVGDVGKAISFEKDLPCADCTETIYLDERLDTTKDKKEQVVTNLKAACIKHNLDPTYLAMDATGGGDVFATLMSRDPFFSNKFMKVQFGGEASQMITDGRKGVDKFVNMVSELWYAAKSLLRMGQIRGLRPEIVREMTLRLYEESGSKKKVKIEPKKDMKTRLNGRSPDAADAYFLFIHAARSRLGLRSADGVAKIAKKAASDDPMAGMFDWGKPKKKRVNQDDGNYVSSSGGWGDEGGSAWSP